MFEIKIFTFKNKAQQTHQMSIYCSQVMCMNKQPSYSNKALNQSKETGGFPHSKVIYHKIKNIKALDRAIFNLSMRVNGIFDKDYNVLEKKHHHLDDHMESLNKLVKLKKLKDDWEKELVDMYIKRIKS